MCTAAIRPSSDAAQQHLTAARSAILLATLPCPQVEQQHTESPTQHRQQLSAHALSDAARSSLDAAPTQRCKSCARMHQQQIGSA